MPAVMSVLQITDSVVKARKLRKVRSWSLSNISQLKSSGAGARPGLKIPSFNIMTREKPPLCIIPFTKTHRSYHAFASCDKDAPLIVAGKA
jgi:hypothetical protein